MSLFYPTVDLQGVSEITPELMSAHEVSALVIDIDNTLTTHNNPEIRTEELEWLERMKQQKIPMVLVSNNNVPRVEPFANLVELPYVANAKKPLSSGFQRAQEILKVSQIQRIAMVGDQIFTDVYGGNRYGMKTFWVTPMQMEGGFFFNLKRWAEQKVIDRYYKQKESNR